jgi:hypothetical protein
MSRSPVTIAAVLLSALVLSACGGGDHAQSDAASRIVCVDSTFSTDAVRARYLPGIEEVAREAANAHAPFYAAACGANATGTVDWPVHKVFASRAIYSGELAAQYADSQVKKIIPRLKRLVETSSPQPGTPLGQMLAVAARQCAAVGGGCSVFVFTDGGWADRLLRVRDGVTAAEQRRYVAAYAPRLRGLAGASVYFVGVGFGTSLGEARLHDAQRVATALVQKAGGQVKSWNVRLPTTPTS